MNTESWGKSDQKIILVNDDDFTEIQEHLNTGKWSIETISACSHSNNEKGFTTSQTYAYVVLEKN